MAPTTTSDFSRMTVQERLALIQAIWDSIEAEGGTVPLTAAQSRTLRKREANAKRHPDAEADSAAVDSAVAQRIASRGKGRTRK
jgi:putative addiction module component (TIGR02574 family)